MFPVSIETQKQSAASLFSAKMTNYLTRNTGLNTYCVAFDKICCPREGCQRKIFHIFSLPYFVKQCDNNALQLIYEYLFRIFYLFSMKNNNTKTIFINKNILIDNGIFWHAKV